jgi:membrane glycosyltransferase
MRDGKHSDEKVMTAQELVLAIAIGAAAVALWLDARLESRTPSTAAWTAVHLCASTLALSVMPLFVKLLVAGTGGPVRVIAAVLVLVLPVFTYCWLSAIWLLRLLQGATRVRF